MVSILPENGRSRRSKLLAVILGIIFGSFVFPGILGWGIFKGSRRGRPGPDILMSLEMELVDAARGINKTIELSRHEFCDECGGSAWRKDSFPPRCNDCDGRGEVITIRRFFPAVIICPTCAGEAPPVTDPCPACRGAGRTAQVVRLLVDVPPGVETGMWLQFRNQGELGDLGAPRGNLRIQIKVKKHPIFDRRHNDLYCQVAVSQTAMTAGATVQVPTLGRSCPLVIPKGTVQGDLLRMEGLGMPDIGGSFRGDLVVEVVLERVEK
jgi:molecular chaperone DnaJ